MSDLAALLASCRALLLDFDGPVCQVFAGLPAPDVADTMRRFLEERGVTLPAEFDDNRDPLKVLAWAGKAVPDLVGPADDLLRSQELAAVETAAPTAGTVEAIAAARWAGAKVAIVSNNSEPAIRRYLDLHQLVDQVNAVVGRRHGRPDRMKPKPDVIETALDQLGVRAAVAVLVGDSPSDIEAALTAGVHAVGYAKGVERAPGLFAAGAELVVGSMNDLNRRSAIA